MGNKKFSAEIADLSIGNINERNYWINKLSGELLNTNIPYDNKCNFNTEYEMKKIKFAIENEIFNGIIKICNGSDIKLHMILVTAVTILLSKYSGRQDIIVGTPIYKQEVSGKLINSVLALRNEFEDSISFKNLLLKVRETIVEATKNQNYPIEAIMHFLNMDFNYNEFPLFDVGVLLENVHDRTYFDQININTIFNFKRLDDSIECVLEYSSRLFTEGQINRVFTHINEIFEQCISNVNILVKDIDILTEYEKNQILYEFNNTENITNVNKTLYELFEEQVEKTPNNIAVVLGNECLTYKELNEKSNQLARILREKGVKADTFVGIMVNRSIEMIVGILAILKAGGAYLPLDPSYPMERKMYMLQDSNIDILITDSNNLDIKLDCIVIKLNSKEILQQDDSNLKFAGDLNHNAYMIYTSGTTGNPKGVVVKHKNIVNTLCYRKAKYNMDSQVVSLQLFSYAFDGFITSFFTPIISGGKVVLLNEESISDINKIRDAIVANSVTHILCIPIFCQKIIECLSKEDARTLKVITLAGDSATSNIYKDIAEKNNKILVINEYGVTEAAVMSSIYGNVQENNYSIIGKPIWNSKMYIVDKYNRLQPVGVPGELCISGVGVAKGYFNRDELTKEKFIDNPFNFSNLEESNKVYKTGDLARWLPDGNIEFLGRIDNQVKIRGFRIEIREVESKLHKHPDIKECVIIARNDTNGDRYLCAYIVSPKNITVSELREFLLQELPEYMIPSYFVNMSHIPITVSGKVDRSKLPEIEKSINSGAKYEAPRNEVERKLSKIWREVLLIKSDIGINDNFFELGGHSLKATTLISKIHKEFNVRIPLMEMFKNATIKSMSEYICNSEKNEFREIQKIEEKEYYTVSSAQKRMYILNQLDPSSLKYNMYSAMEIDGELDINKFERAFKKLIERHESLRTKFELKHGEPVQIVLKELDWGIEYIHQEDKKGINDIVKGFINVFKLNKPPLFRVGLIKISELKHILIIDMHHIISDGASMGILIQEFVDLYNNKELNDIKIQYKDFSEWQNNFFKSNEMKIQEEFWKKQYNDNIPVLNMPLDFQRSEEKSSEGKTISFSILNENAIKLNKFAQEQNITLNMLLFSIYKLIIWKYSNQDDIVVGSLVAGRNHNDLNNTIGMFANFLPIRTKINNEQTFLEYVNQLKYNILCSYENKDYPFEKIVENLKVSPQRSRNPLFDTMFIFHNQFDINKKYEFDDISFKKYKLENNTSTLDFKMDMFSSYDNELKGYLQYNIKLFTEESMKSFIRHFNELMAVVMNNPERTLNMIDLFSEDEKMQLEEKRKLNEVSGSDNINLAISATFTAEPIENYIKWWGKQVNMNLEVKFTPYNQVFQQLLDKSSLISTNNGINILLVRFEDFIRDENTSAELKCKKIEESFNELIQILYSKKKCVPYFIGVFPLCKELMLDSRVERCIEEINKKWANVTNEIENIYLIDFNELKELYEIEQIYDYLKDKSGHVPFTDEFYAAMGTIIARKIRALKSKPYKVIVLDCDNTLWNGICGEGENCIVDIEEPFIELQKFMLKKYKEGILLALCSKNNVEDVREVFDKNSKMVLKRENFIISKINWMPKSENIKELAKELNLGLDSFIFIDDNPVECLEVETNCEGVLVLQLPEDITEYSMFLKHVWAFDHLKISNEDTKRNEMYKSEIQRKEALNKSISLEDFLENLDLEVEINSIEKSQIQRVSQLTQRTNQFNLSSIRRNEIEISSLLEEANVQGWSVIVSDRFGDYGLVGTMIVSVKDNVCNVDTFLLSCRALGRRVENRMIKHLVEYCNNNDIKEIQWRYIPTNKNKVFENFIKETDMKLIEQSEGYMLYIVKID